MDGENPSLRGQVLSVANGAGEDIINCCCKGVFLLGKGKPLSMLKGKASVRGLEDE